MNNISKTAEIVFPGSHKSFQEMTEKMKKHPSCKILINSHHLEVVEFDKEVIDFHNLDWTHLPEFYFQNLVAFLIFNMEHYHRLPLIKCGHEYIIFVEEKDKSGIAFISKEDRNILLKKLLQAS